MFHKCEIRCNKSRMITPRPSATQLAPAQAVSGGLHRNKGNSVFVYPSAETGEVFLLQDPAADRV